MVMLLALAGCEVGPDYAQQQPQLGPFRNASAVAGRAAISTASLDQWWSGFQDPVLTSLIDRALAENLDIAAALARVQQANASAAAAGALLLPTVDLDAAGTLQHQSREAPLGRIAGTLPGYNRDQQIYSAGGAASWEIDLFGGLRRGTEAAKAEAEAAQADSMGTRISIAAEVADSYFRLRGAQERIAVAEEQIATDRHLQELVRLQFSRQIATEREVSQAEALLKQAEATLPLLTIEREAQMNRIDVLLGLQPGSSATILTPPRAIPSIPAIPSSDTPLDVLRRRPDIRAAERHVAAASARIGVAISDYYPKLSLSGLLGFESMSINHFATSRAFQPLAAGGLRWRLFDFGKVGAEVDAARGADAEALAQYRQAVLKAAEDVENAFVQLTQTETRTQIVQAEVAALQKARDLSQQSYSSGVIPLTDVLDADRQLLRARDDLAANRANAARAAVKTFRALGGGWQT